MSDDVDLEASSLFMSTLINPEAQSARCLLYCTQMGSLFANISFPDVLFPYFSAIFTTFIITADVLRIDKTINKSVCVTD